MLNIYTYRCQQCGHEFESYVKDKDDSKLLEGLCANCGGTFRKVPSVPGFRYDHTVNGGG